MLTPLNDIPVSIVRRKKEVEKSQLVAGPSRTTHLVDIDSNDLVRHTVRRKLLTRGFEWRKFWKESLLKKPINVPNLRFRMC